MPAASVSQEQGGASTRARPPRRRPGSAVAVAVVIAVAVLAAVLGASALTEGKRSTGGAPAAGEPVVVKIGGVPVGLAADAAAGTVYVAAGRAGLVLLSAAACRAADASRCRARRVPAGGPVAAGVVVDSASHTVYVANGPAGTVAVINSASCNAVTSRGCSAPAALIRVQGVVQALALDQRAGVLYADVLAAPGGQPAASALQRRVAVISTRACDASVTTGCETAATVPVGQVLRAAIAVDQATGTVYAAGPSRLAIISGRACATRKASGCAKVVATIAAYGYITGIAADAGMVYVTSPGTGTVTMLRASACGVATTTGCTRPVLIRAGPGPLTTLPDPPAHTLYVTDNAASTVSMVDPAACGRIAAARCPPFAPEFPVGYAPGDATADTATGTLFVANLGSRSVSLISTATCNAALRHGCPARSPAGTPATQHTAYTCDPAVAAYQSGQPARPFLQASTRVAAGTTGGEAWSVWARKSVFDPNGIEQGGLVLGGRWYALCSAPLSAAADAASIELIDTPGHGTVYGYVQHSQRVAITLTAAGLLPRPASVALRGITFFIETLPRSACGYHALTLHGQAPGWAASTTLTLGSCEPGDLTDVLSSDGTEGPARPRSGH